MKRTISIVLLLVCVLASSAQIQSKFFSFTLGESTMKEVYYYLEEKQYDITNNPINDGFMINNKMKFADCVWSKVLFTFYENKLYCIAFYDDENNAPKTILDDKFVKVSKYLNDKYLSFCNENEPDCKIYSDEKVFVGLERRYNNDKTYILLNFMSVPIMDKKRKPSIMDKIKKEVIVSDD